jgi:AraC-like DNA-binding protein
VRIHYGDGRVAVGRSLLIEPGVAHCLAPVAAADIYFVEPTARAGLPAPLRDRLRADQPPILSEPGAPNFWISAAAPDATVSLDTRVARGAAAIDRRLEGGTVRLADVAAEAGLSPERFRHLFAAEIGIAFRRYVLWRRVGVAARSLAAGAGLTGAAHAAGFADAAHLARTTKAMFGITTGAAF